MLALIRVYHFPLISRDDALRTKQQERYEQKIAYLEGESRSDLGGFDWPWTYVDTRSSNRRALVAETRSESIFGPSMTARLDTRLCLLYLRDEYSSISSSSCSQTDTQDWLALPSEALLFCCHGGATDCSRHDRRKLPAGREDFLHFLCNLRFLPKNTRCSVVDS